MAQMRFSPEKKDDTRRVLWSSAPEKVEKKEEAAEPISDEPDGDQEPFTPPPEIPENPDNEAGGGNDDDAASQAD